MSVTRSPMNLTAVARLAELADYSAAFAIRAAAALGIADLLTDGPRDVTCLAQQSQCDPHALLRLMRALAGTPVFIERPVQTFALGPMGALLRTDHPLSMRWLFRLEPDIQALTDLEYSLRTGQPAFEHLFGMKYTAWLSANPDAAARLRTSERAQMRIDLPSIAGVYPWPRARAFVDVCGADGSLVAMLLRQNPTLRGTLFDSPEAVQDAPSTFECAGVADRARIVSGDLRHDEVPAGADCYTLRRVLLQFDDEDAIAALTRLSRVMQPHSRLLIIEPLRDLTDEAAHSLDLLTLVLGYGHVRSLEELTALLVSAALTPTTVASAASATIVVAQTQVQRA